MRFILFSLAARVLSGAAADTGTMTLFPGTPAGRLSRAWMGCHLDEGFTQQTFSWSRSLLVSHSFESYHSFAVQAWSDATDAGATGTTSLDNSTQVNPNARVPSLKVSFQSGVGVVGSANRGMGGEGLALASAPYDGFAVVLAPAGGSLYVALRPRGGGAPLSSTTITLSRSAAWQQVNFSLTPSAPTSCEGIAPGSDATVDCGALTANPGSV